LVALDDDGNAPLALRMNEHALEAANVVPHIHELERHVPPGEVLTGGFRVGSRVLAEDVDHEAHRITGSVVH
jgi:hypothetical protein